MGGGSSVNANLEQRAFQLVTIVQDGNYAEQVAAWKELLQYSDNNDYKALLCRPELNLLPVCRNVLENSTDTQVLDLVTHTLWFLSRNNSNAILLGSSEQHFISIFMKLIRSRKDSVRDNLVKMFTNILMHSETHNYVLTPEFQFFNVFKQLLESEPKNAFHAKVFANLCTYADFRTIERFCEHNLPDLILKLFQTYGSNVNRWPSRNGGSEYWLLLILLATSNIPQGAQYIRNWNHPEFLQEIVSSGASEGIKAAIVVANVYGKDENSPVTKALLVAHPSILSGILDMFEFCFNPPDESIHHPIWQIPYAILQLRDLSSALKNLAISDENQKVMISSPLILEYSLICLNSYLDNAPQFSAMGNLGDTLSAGGGGGDHITVQNILELLTQLSFYYDEDEELQASSLGTGEIRNMLEQFIRLPPERNFPYEAKQFVLTLLKRLNPAPAAVSVTAPSIVRPTESKRADVPQQHIMLSYAWGCKKENVIALGKRLRELGYDVWRDEEGSRLLPSMSGDIAERMAEAVELSYMMVICVSPAYKESTNCRSEAKYARARQVKGLQIAYVMMEDEYHAKVDGWLGFMIGSELWYPLWSSGQVNSTAEGLAGLIGDHAKASNNQLRVDPAAASSMLSENRSPSPVFSPNDARPTPSEKRNYEKAWSNLDGKKSSNPEALTQLLEELGVYSLEDFEGLPEEYFEQLASLLKPAPQNNFRKAMLMK